MSNYLFIIPELCTGCNRCSYVCSAIKEGEFIPSRSRIHISNFPLKGRSIPSICFQCEEAACMEACPADAIERDENGIVVVSEEKCTGCGSCVEACPYGMMGFSQEKNVAFKCDYCGGDPECVKECHFGALVFEKLEEKDMEKRKTFMSYKSEATSEAEKRIEWAKKIFESIWSE